MIGVSPAYFFSKFGKDFHLDDYLYALPRIKKQGFERYQGEIYQPSRLQEWETGIDKLIDLQEALGLQMSQFVAHFLVVESTNIASFLQWQGPGLFERVVRCVAKIPNCTTVIIPLPPFENTKAISPTLYQQIGKAFVRRMRMYANIATLHGLRLGLEIMPQSILGGVDGLLHLTQLDGCQQIGFCFDIGHLLLSGENIPLVCAKLQGKILGTHIKDMKKGSQEAVAPGKGDVDFSLILQCLSAASYHGSLDLEIPCNPFTTDNCYEFGLATLQKIGANNE